MELLLSLFYGEKAGRDLFWLRVRRLVISVLSGQARCLWSRAGCCTQHGAAAHGANRFVQRWTAWAGWEPGAGEDGLAVESLEQGRLRHMGGIGRGGSGWAVRAAGEEARRKAPPSFSP